MSEWTPQETRCIEKYFNNSSSMMTLFLKLTDLRPDRTYEAMTRRIRRMRDKGWERRRETAIKKLRVGYLDIEATDLRADWGHMLTWYIKAEGKNQYDFGCITKKEIFDEEFDRRILEELLIAFDNYDVLWTHWGVDRRFDIPFIRTRAYAHGFQHMLPEHFEKFIMDTWPIARNKLKLFSNRLDNIAEALGVKVKKTPLSPKRWQVARVGNEKALEYILLHNRRDVQILERVHQKLRVVDRPVLKSM